MTSTAKHRVRDSIEAWLVAPPDRREVLLLRVKAASGRHPGFWQPVTGGVQPGETAGQARLREIEEETGLVLSAPALSLVITGFDVPISPALTVRKQVFVARAPGRSVRVAPDEHVDHRWVGVDAVERMLYWESNRTTWSRVRPRLETCGQPGDRP